MALLKQILAPTDFSPNSSQAINYACDLAKQSNARLHLVHAIGNGSVANRDEVERLERIGSMVDARAELSVETVKEVVSGNPAQVIRKYAMDNEIDMVVMGTRGRTGLAHLAMGSVAKHVLRAAPCPVLVIGPHDGETVSLGRAAQVLATARSVESNETFEEGRTRMHQQLTDELRIPTTSAMLLFDELQDRKWLRYENGKWIVAEESETAQESDSFVPDFATDSAAMELIKRAKRLSATDLHIDPAEHEKHLVRLRIDGQLKSYCKLHGDVAVHLINQLKTLAGVDISDPFRPKEAHLRLPSEFADMGIRMTTIPVAGGQAVSLRLFDTGKISLPMDNLGFSESALESVEKMIEFGEGLVLIAGPSGSGITTTVYSMLQSLSGDKNNIVSIEDPVEYAVSFVRQVSVDVRHEITFTDGLKAILRMDPDIVFIGEIRNADTAAIGMQAANSGKYIFSTMHTRDVASTITALRDMNIDDRTLSTNLTGIVNQRLVRRLCEHCKQPNATTPEQAERFTSLELEVPDQLFEPVGCSDCYGTGFHGRVGVFEVGNITPELRNAIHSGQSESEIERQLRSSGVASLESDALAKSATGMISFEEAIGIRWLT